MAKFCNYCGTQLEDSATFCANCGAQLGKAPASSNNGTTKSTSTPSFEVPKPNSNFIKENKNKLIGIAGAVVVVILVIVIASSIISGLGYKGPIKDYFKAINKEDGKLMCGIYPEFYTEDIDKDEDDYEDTIENIRDSFSVGKDPKISYDILEKIEYDDDQIKKTEKAFNKRFKDALDKDEVEISDVYEVLLKVTLKGSRDKQEYFQIVTVAKIDGKWYNFDFASGLNISSIDLDAITDNE